ncbi:MAG: MGMT family protein, partial [Candidatus Micrarchaeota archaeon]|nr:MGMT family protein [Candidatus Micrarchaeota archaeon]
MAINKGSEEFRKKVYEILLKMPKGKVITYKRLAELAGRKNAARAVGAILKTNKRPDLIPCYKVIKSNGEIG